MQWHCIQNRSVWFWLGSTEWFDTEVGIESDGDEEFYSIQDGKKFLDCWPYWKNLRAFNRPPSFISALKSLPHPCPLSIPLIYTTIIKSLNHILSTNVDKLNWPSPSTRSSHLLSTFPQFSLVGTFLSFFKYALKSLFSPNLIEETRKKGHGDRVDGETIPRVHGRRRRRLGRKKAMIGGTNRYSSRSKVDPYADICNSIDRSIRSPTFHGKFL